MRVLLCPLSDPGYLYPALAVGRELRSRGHLVAVLCGPRATRTVALAGLLAVSVEEYGDTRLLNVGSRPFNQATIGQYTAVRETARDFGADVLLTSVLCQGSLLAAESLDVPCVVAGFSTWLWPFRQGGADPEDDAYREWLVGGMRQFYDEARAAASMRPRRDRHPEQPLLGAAFLLRGHPDLEPEGVTLPDEVCYVGPCAWEPDAAPEDVAQVADQLRSVGKPVVYVHLGRDFGGDSLWPRLNAAFTGTPFQAIVEQGRSGRADPAPGADVLVIRKPWMDPVISMATLVLTNATSAPVLGALRHGIPLVVAPNGSEQPLLAASCIRTGVAALLPDDPSAAAETLSSAVVDPRLAERAALIGSKLRASGGAKAAAAIVQDCVGARISAPAAVA
jgi:UDP:flavonoid glycosyltransferase YjiC (YdhE family)